MSLKLFGNKKILFSLLFLSAVAVAIGYLCFSSPPVLPSGDPNVVLITVDALRADHLGCYGYQRNTSPNIDALARKGALFTQAIAQSSHAPTSLGVIATSTYPPTNQLRGWGDTLRPDIPTLAETLKARGYKTFFANGNGNLYRGLHGFDKGFDTFYDKGVPASTLTQQALALVGKNNTKPFFLWIHYMDVHEYFPSKELESLFINDMFYSRQNKIPIVKNDPGLYGKNGIPEFRANKSGGNDNPDYYVAVYDGAIRSVDKQIGSLLKKLRQTNRRRDLLVVFTSDYGEMLGEHGYYFHQGWFLYEPLLRVPLIFNCASIIPAKKVGPQVSAGLDIFPTLLGFLKKQKPEILQGTDLSPLMLGEGSEGASPHVISDEGHSKTSVRTDRWKLIRSSENPGSPATYELYNLRKDPGELKNRFSVEKETFAVLKEKLAEYYEKVYGIKTVDAAGEDPRKGL